MWAFIFFVCLYYANSRTNNNKKDGGKIRCRKFRQVYV